MDHVRPGGVLTLSLLLVLPAGGSPLPDRADREATVSGVVRIEAATQPPAASSRGRYRRGARPAQPAAAESTTGNELANVVIYLEPVDGSPPSTGVSRATLDQKEKTFVPHVLPIRVGSTVEITNQDGIYHNVFSLTDVRPFNIGRRPTGERVPVEFDKPGVVRVFCDIHSHMSAFIVVLDTPYFTTPGEDGTFEIDNVAAGRYRATAWHPNLTAEAQEVVVGASGRQQIDFVLR